ncbi:MAG: NHL repeat-containing protein, partial [Smithellaceae bacterium]
MSSFGRFISGLFASIFLMLAVCGVCAADNQVITLEKRKEIIAPDRTLPDGSHLIRVQDRKRKDLQIRLGLQCVQTWKTQVVAYAIDFDRNGNFYVSDIAGKMEKLSPTGQHLTLIDLSSHLLSIRSLAIDRTGTEDVIFLADEFKREVHRYVINPSTSSLTHTGPFSVTPAGATHTLSPHGFAFRAPGELLISDTANHLIFHCNDSLTGIKIIKPTGTGETGLNCPRQLAYHPGENLIYVADRNNARIVVMDMNGNVVRKWGKDGTQTGEFKIPHGLILDTSRNLVYVGDTGNNRVQVFDTRGTFKSQWQAADFREPRYMT